MTKLMWNFAFYLTLIAMPFAVFAGLGKQAEIRADAPSDYCRAHPAACDVPNHR